MIFETINAAARANALAIMGGFHPALDENFGQTILLFGPQQPDFWPAFSASPEYTDGATDPLDRWSTRVITALAADLGARALFPFGGAAVSTVYRLGKTHGPRVAVASWIADP